MRNLLRSVIIVVFYIFIYSCTSPVKTVNTEGKIKGDVFRSELIGWEMKIPEGWKVLSNEELYYRDNKGLSYIDKNQEKDITISGKHLIVFQKDMFNNFDASVEPIMFDNKKGWQEFRNNSKALIVETLTNLGAQFDTISDKIYVSNVDLDVFHIALKGPMGGVVLRQELYSCYLNGHDFSVTISYNNENDKKTMFDALKNSKFDGK
ncbi:MAG: hypothetical protein ACWA6U_17795 [Breznakibacter sp.]